MTADVAVVEALARASVEHDDWLRMIREPLPDDGPHPWMGWGATCSDVAQVLFHGATRNRAWQLELRRRGLVNLHVDWPWAKYARVRDAIFAATLDFQETASERQRAAWQLRRAESLGLVGRRRTHRGSGGMTFWFVAENTETVRVAC